MTIKNALRYLLTASLIMAFGLTSVSASDNNNKSDDSQTTTIQLANQTEKPTFNRTANNFVAPEVDVTAKAYVLMDYNSGTIISSKNMDQRLPPASLTKLMTMYLVSSALRSGQITPDTKVHISEKAWRTGGSRMFVKVNTDVPVKDLLKGIIVASGNDACVALAEHIAGSETAFAALMNQAAQEIGMTNTHFVDSTGLPNENHYTTPKDLALLTRALIREFPEYYAWYKQKWFTYNDIKQPNRNRLLWRDSTVDGVKTGHTDAAGFCLISSAKRKDTRIISVVMGANSDNARASDSQTLLNYAFRFFESHKLFSGNKTINEPRIWSGAEKTTPIGVTEDLFVSIPMGQYPNLKANMAVKNDLQAPIKKGEQLGELEIKLNDKVIASKPIVALDDNEIGGIWARTRDRVVRIFH